MKTPGTTATLPRVDNATKEQLLEKANEISKVASLRGKFDVVFEDTTFAGIGRSDKYQAANGEIIVQRPANIYLKIEAPVVKVDIAQMTSNGKRFCVAILEDGGSGKYKKFLCGTNDADYSVLQKVVSEMEIGGDDKSKIAKKNVNAFSNIRPQHFTDALLIKPLAPSAEIIYIQSEFFQVESNPDVPKNSPLAEVNRGYYLLDELKKKGEEFVIMRRFWFDRSDNMAVRRQQIFNDAGMLESDIVYGNIGMFTESEAYAMPMRIDLTRPKEKYKMRLTYEAPKAVIIGKEWPDKIFNLENRWGLPEVDLDKKLSEAKQSASQGKTSGEQ